MSNTQKELIAAAKSGNRAEFDRLFETNEKELQDFLGSMKPSRCEADNAINAMFSSGIIGDPKENRREKLWKECLSNHPSYSCNGVILPGARVHGRRLPRRRKNRTRR